MALPSLHKSTIIVGIVAVVVAVLLEMPGHVVFGTNGADVMTEFEHGWPWVYLHRRTHRQFPVDKIPPERQVEKSASGIEYWFNTRTNVPMWGVPWLNVDGWLFWQSNERSGHPGHKLLAKVLLGDVAVSLVATSIVVFCWELRRRRRPSALSFGLGDILVAFAIVASALGWWMYMRREFDREQRFETRIDVNAWDTLNFDCVAPLWMRSLVGERLLPSFLWRTTGASIYSDDIDDPAKAERIVEEIKQFRFVSQVSVHGNPNSTPFPFAILGGIKRLETLDLTSYGITDEKTWLFSGRLNERDMAEIMQIEQLRKLELLDRSDIPSSQLPRLEQALPNCRIIGLDDPAW